MMVLAGALLSGVLATGPAPILFGPSADLVPADQADQADPGAPPARRDGMGRRRLRLVTEFAPSYGTLLGRIEKEDSDTGLGSGGDKVSLRSDLGLPRHSWAWQGSIALEPAPHFRIRFATELFAVDGKNVLSEGFRHDGLAFAPGTAVRAKFSGALGDLEFHFLPRQAVRRRGEFGLFAGLRAAHFRHVVESPTVGHVGEQTTGVWPKFGLQGYGDIGSGVTLWGRGAIGAWFNGDNADSYAAASFEAEAGMGWVVEQLLHVRIGYRYHTLGVWREHRHDMERVTIERGALLISLTFRTP